MTTTIEVFAEVTCPFAHVSLRRFVDERTRRGSHEHLHVLAWPLEVVNGAPMDAEFIAEEVDDIRRQVADDLFVGFDVSAFPSTTLPALALAHAAYQRSLEAGEAVSLELRRLLFEQGVDVSDPDVLLRLADDHAVEVDLDDRSGVLADHAAGQARGVIGSPHFFTATDGFFCPALDISRGDDGHLHVGRDVAGFDRFLRSCFD